MDTLTAIVAMAGVLLAAGTAVVAHLMGKRAGSAAELQRLGIARETAEDTAERIVGEAQREAETLRKTAVLTGKEELIKLRENWEIEARHRREEVEREERHIQERETILDRKFDLLEQREREAGRRSA